MESNYSGRSSHMLSLDKRLPLDTWYQSGLQENIFGSQFLVRLIHPEIILKEFNLTTCKKKQRSSP